MNLRYPTVLFDWDGTLGDTLSHWFATYKEVLKSFDLYPTDRQIGAQFGDVRGVMQLGLPEDRFDDFWVLMQQRVNTAPAVSLYEGAALLLRDLRDAGARLGLVTTSPRELLTPALERNDIATLFDVIVTGDEVEHHKPHPEPVEKALAALSSTSKAAVMIGDSDKDMGAARAAGVDSVLLHLPDHATFYDRANLLLHEPTHEVNSFAALRDLLFSAGTEQRCPPVD